MKTSNLLIFCLLILCSGNYSSQTVYRKNYTDIYYMSQIVSSNDRGYMIVGSNRSLSTANSNMCVMKTDSMGTVQWTRTYGKPNVYEEGSKIIKTFDRGFILSNSSGLIKIDSLGHILWQKAYQTLSSSSTGQEITDLIQLSDSSLMIAGESNSGNYNLLMKLDKNGNVIWANSHSQAQHISKIIALPGGEFFVTGSSGSTFYIGRHNSSGGLIWGRKYAAMKRIGNYILPTADGNYLFVGDDFSTTNVLTMMKIDINGNVYWAKSYGLSGISPYSYSVYESPSGNFTVLADAFSYHIALTVDFLGNNPGSVSANVTSGGRGCSNYVQNPDQTYSTVLGSALFRGGICGSSGVTTTIAGLSPTPVAISPAYNTYGTASDLNVYNIRSIVTVTTACGTACDAVFNAPDTVCQGAAVTFSFAGTGTPTCLWKENGIAFSTALSPVRNFNIPGNYKIELATTAGGGTCKSATSKYIYVRGDCGTNGNTVGYFSKSYTNLNSIYAISKTADKGFIVAGSSSLTGTPDMCLVKTDSLGAVQWGKAYGNGSLSEYAAQTKQTPDGGYLVAGNDNYVFAVKSNSAGVVVWENNYQLVNNSSGSTSQTVKDMIITPDSGAIMVGLAPSGYGMLFKTSKTGAVVWANHLLGSGNTVFNSITKAGSNEYLIAGQVGSLPALVKIDGTGNVIWSKQYPFGSVVNAFSVIKLADGNFMMHIRDNYNNWYFVKVDPNGDIIWARSYAPGANMVSSSIIEDTDNGFIVSSFYNSRIYFFKFDNLARFVSGYYSSAPAAQLNTNLQRASDGSYVVGCGNTLIKFNAFNTLAVCNATVTNFTSAVTSASVATNITFTSNTYAVPNNQFFVTTPTTHVITTNCSNTGCNSNALFVAPLNVCINQPVTFTNASLGGVSYTWTETGIPFATTANATHTFGSAGTYNVTMTMAGNNGCNGSYSMYITAGNAPTATVSSNTTITCGGSVNLTASGGTSYNWSPAIGLSNPNTANPVASPSATTVYTVTVNNGGSCSATAVVTVSVSGTPVVNITGATTICQGNSVVLTANGATSYTWSVNAGSVTTGTVSVAPGSNATYSVTGANGSCTNTSVISLTVNPKPTVAVNSGAICSGNSFTINATGADTYTYTGGSAIVSPTATTNYSVTGTSTAGCVSLPAISSITLNPLPSISVNSGAICIGQSFTINPTGANTYTFSSGTAVVSPTTTSSYSVTGTSIDGCVSSMAAVASVTVNPNPVISVNSGSICAGQSFTMNPSGADTYSYTGGSAVVSPIGTSGYSVTGTDANGCISASPAVSNVMVNALPVISAVTTKTLLCAGETATLTANGADTYTWNPGGVGMSIVVSPGTTTTYSLMGLGINGCANSTVFTQSVSLCTGIAKFENLNLELSIYPNPFNDKITVMSNGSQQTVHVFNATGAEIYTAVIENETAEIDLHNQASGIYFIRIGSATRKLIKE